MDGRSGSFAVFSFTVVHSGDRGRKMIVSGTNHNSVDMIRRGQGNIPGRGGKNDSVRSGNEFFARMLEAPQGESEKAFGNVSAKEEFSKNQTSVSQLIRRTSQDEKQLSKEELLQLLADHREEILKKIKNGDTGVKIPIGSMYLTQEEWEKLLDSFDEAQEKIQEEVRAERGEALPEKRPDTTVNGDKVFAPEDTGHELKPLEELIGETNVKGKTAGDFDDGNLLTDEEDERQA